MATRLPSSGPGPVNPPLPTSFRSIRDILSENVRLNSLINVVGVVKDMQAPIDTHGTDCKCKLKIYDKSTEDTDDILPINIFRPRGEMPNLVAGDVFVAFSIKKQDWRGETSLITHRSTSIHIYSRDAIPRPPSSAKNAMKPNGGQKGKMPGDSEHLYVSWLYHNIEKITLPSAVEYQEQVQRSTNVREKFSLLEGVREAQFCDLIVRVAQDPYDLLDKCTVWVTDYTENKDFFHHKMDTSVLDDGVDGDPYGYTAKHRIQPVNSWPGPFGKRSLQVTCYEPHATYIREAARGGNRGIRGGDWIKLRNVQVKHGRNGNNLEGFLRGDQRYPERLGVELLDTSGDSESIDPRLKEALRRNLDYNKTVKWELKELTANRRGNGTKRKAEGKLNSKQRRKLARSKKEKELEVEKARVFGLNDLVKCESENRDLVPLSRIMEGTEIKLRCAKGEERSTMLPFDNIKFRANVRVVDYCPPKLEDFTAWRRRTEFDLLSDNGMSSGPEPDTDNDEGTLDRFAGEKVWEWRFALELEEFDPKRNKNDKPPRVWALVENIEAQQLTKMDAVDLRANREDAEILRERLFVLWGNLEECKRREYEQNLRTLKSVNAKEAPPDSSDDEAANPELGANKPPTKVSNKPFTCCLRQYGIKVPESDARKCDAGEGKRYQRLFGLFGTTISSS